MDFLVKSPERLLKLQKMLKGSKLEETGESCKLLFEKN